MNNLDFTTFLQIQRAWKLINPLHESFILKETHK